MRKTFGLLWVWLKENWKKLAVMLLVAAGGIFLLDIGCLFRLLTGFPCPGCGMTRAHLAALQLDFGAAFYYHPLWFMAVPAVFLSVFRPKGLFASKKANNLLTLGLLILVLGIYITRMLLYFPDIPPMVYNRDSLLWNIISKFYS